MLHNLARPQKRLETSRNTTDLALLEIPHCGSPIMQRGEELRHTPRERECAPLGKKLLNYLMLTKLRNSHRFTAYIGDFMSVMANWRLM